MICYRGSPIVSIGSTVIWLLSLVIAIAASIKAKEVEDKDTIGNNLMIAIINTFAWASDKFNIGYPCWPPFAFVLLWLLFSVQLLSDLNVLAG